MAIVTTEFFAPSLAPHEDCSMIEMHIPRRRRFDGGQRRHDRHILDSF
jgi:hypothetical protein